MVAYVLGLLVIVGVLYAFTTKEKSEYTTIEQPKWENLKVLPQDISKDSLKGLMKGYTKSLGVKCSYCHSPKKNNPKKLDFPDDSKLEKKIARGMIEMTNDINARHFRPYYPDPKPTQVRDVKCIMCHRGNSNPEKYLGDVSKFYDNEKLPNGHD